MHKVDVKKVRAFIQEHPEFSYYAFKKQSNLKISDCYYYILRRQITGVKEPARVPRKNNVFVKVFSVSEEGLSEQALQVIKGLIDALNEKNRSRLQLLRYPETKILEVRDTAVK